MYEQHFGLRKRLFPAQATGADVFVGPQTAKTMGGFRKALAAQDAVVTVSGPVGTGKTTLVHRALEGLGTKYKTIRVGRMEMKSSDVLESLLIVLGVQDRPSGTIARFAALRRKLKELQEAEVRVFIVIEDGLRTGAETLAELEALTAADAGDSDGASIIVMGDERLPQFMQDPEVAQLQQRVRQRHTILPLCTAELRGYLTHCFRLAGGDFEHVFDARSAELLHELSNGIPRIANNLVESTLVAAAGQGIDRIPATLMATVASDEYGLSADNFDFSIPEPVVEVTPEPAPEPAPVVDAAPEPEPEPVVDVAPEPKPEPEPEPVVDAAPEPGLSPENEPPKTGETQPVIVFSEETEERPEDDDDIPHLIQDTLPDLKTLAPQFATLPDEDAEEIPELVAEPGADFESVTEIIPELEPEPVAEVIPELTPEPEPEPESEPEAGPGRDFESVTEIIPELEAEPVAEVVPEHTPEHTPEPAPEPEPVAEKMPAPEPEPVAEKMLELEPEPEPVVAENDAGPEVTPEPVAQDAAADEVPEWDRDPTFAELKPDLDALEKAMAFAHGVTVDKPGETPESPKGLSDNAGDKEAIPEITLDKSIETGIEAHLMEEPSDILPPESTKSDVELDKIAQEIGSAKTLDDIDDKMAETLFGSGISMIAAQIRANPPKDESANDAIQLEPDVPQLEPEAPQLEPDIPQLEPEALQLEPEAPAAPAPAVPEVAEEISLETKKTVPNAGPDLSASQRLKTVRALNADLHPSLREPEVTNGAAAKENDAPQPIEDQINTSITQTLKALKVPPEPVDEPEEERKTGFFSRFRRS